MPKHTGHIEKNLPTGHIGWFEMDTPPAGYLAANGEEVSRETYAGLFSAIGTIYGKGNGVTTFKLPEICGHLVHENDGSRGTIAGTFQGDCPPDNHFRHRISVPLACIKT